MGDSIKRSICNDCAPGSTQNCALQNKAKILNQLLCLYVFNVWDHCRSSRYHTQCQKQIENICVDMGDPDRQTTMLRQDITLANSNYTMSTISVKLPPRLLQELCENMRSDFLRILCNATLTSFYNQRTSTCRQRWNGREPQARMVPLCRGRLNRRWHNSCVNISLLLQLQKHNIFRVAEPVVVFEHGGAHASTS